MRILHWGGKDFEVGRVVEIDSPKKFVYIEEQADGTLRIGYSKAFGVDLLEHGSFELQTVAAKPGPAHA